MPNFHNRQSDSFTMPTKHVRTNAQLVRFRASLKVECGESGSVKTMSGQMVVQAGGAGSFSAVRARFVCLRCGAKAAPFVVSPPL